MICLAFDVGKKWGWAVIADGEVYASGSGVFKEILAFEKEIKDLIELYKPEVVGTALPNRFYNTMKTHFKYITVIELCWKKYSGSDFLPLYDSEIKKGIYGTTKVEKTAVKDRFGGETEDEADAIMMGMYLHKVVK